MLVKVQLKMRTTYSHDRGGSIERPKHTFRASNLARVISTKIPLKPAQKLYIHEDEITRRRCVKTWWCWEEGSSTIDEEHREKKLIPNSPGQLQSQNSRAKKKKKEAFVHPVHIHTDYGRRNQKITGLTGN